MAKQKTCPVCSSAFTQQYSTLQKTCSPKCALEWNSKKEVDKRVRQMKADLKKHKDYLNVLQTVFNTYIRHRDKGQPCISCGIKIEGIGHASHFFSVGAHPSLRFDEDNVHVSCVKCNVHLHGNTSNYAYRLPKKIGYERFENLHAKSLEVKKYTIPELIELISYYKQKTKTT